MSTTTAPSRTTVRTVLLAGAGDALTDAAARAPGVLRVAGATAVARVREAAARLVADGDGDDLLLLDADTRLGPGVVDALLRQAELGADLVGPVVLAGSGLQAASTYLDPAEGLGAAAAALRDRHRGRRRHVAWLDPGCLLVSHDLLPLLADLPTDVVDEHLGFELAAHALAAGATACVALDVVADLPQHVTPDRDARRRSWERVAGRHLQDRAAEDLWGLPAPATDAGTDTPDTSAALPRPTTPTPGPGPEPASTAGTASTAAVPLVSGEPHLVLVWPAAASHLDLVDGALRAHVQVHRRLTLQWSDEHFVDNLSRLYGQRLPADSHKSEHVGRGAITVFVVSDPSPTYGERPTSRGTEVVNTRMFDLKAALRNATGGGHRIHGTVSPSETARDATLLLGMDWQDHLAGGPDLDLGTRNLLGAGGWASLEELFGVLDRTVSYVVMRNFEDLPDAAMLDGHDDLDLMVRQRDEVAWVLGARRAFPEVYRTHYHVEVAGIRLPLDLRYVDDGYYPQALAEAMIDGRRRHADVCWVPGDALYFNTLLYHALVHKPGVSADYRRRLTAKFEALTTTRLGRELSDTELVGLLRRFLVERRLQPTRAFDLSVMFNPQVVAIQYQHAATALFPDSGQGPASWR